MTSCPAYLWGQLSCPFPPNRVKFGDPCANPTREIPRGGGILDGFRDNFRLEVAGDVIAAANVGQVGTDGPVKFGDSRADGSRDIRLPHFVTNGDAGVRCSSHAKRRKAENVASTALGRILVVQHFACPHQLVGILFELR